MKHYYFVVICVLLSFPLLSQETLRQFVLFDYNQYELTSESKQVIDNMLKEISPDKITKIELYGHTDSDGDPAANRILSLNRVNAVKQYLLTKGFAESVFVTDHFGEEQPAFSNSTDEGMHKNRRVEIAITHERIKEEVPVIAPVVTRMPDTATSRYQVYDNKCQSIPAEGDTQRFLVTTDKSFDIKGKGGTIISFPAQPFVDANGKTVTGPFTITLIEVYTKSEMIDHRLSTTSNGKMLESAGMIYIAAEANGQPVSLYPRAVYTIQVPTKSKNDGMNLFYADTTKGKMNWKQAQSNFLYDQTWKQNEDSLSKYVFNGTKMGWINCDYFPATRQLTDFKVEVADTAGVFFCLVFANYNSIMAGAYDGKHFKCQNVPVGEVATIVAYKRVNGEIYYFSEDVVIEKNHKQTITLEKISESEYQERTEKFN